MTASAATGLDAAALARMEAWIAQDVRRGELPGAVVGIVRERRLAYLAAFGFADRGAARPMADDAIFRIYSMTKPLTAVAVLLLCERGLLRLDDEVARYLPDFARLRVHRPAAGGAPAAYEDLERPVLVRDLLAHTAGFAGGYHGTPWIVRCYREAGIVPYDHVAGASDEEQAAFVARLTALPLAAQPGRVWEYSRSYEVLAHLCALVTGAPLSRFLREHVLAPLGMADTGFCVRPERAAAVAQPDAPAEPGIALTTLTREPRFVSGGSGAYSTVTDYLRFLDGVFFDPARPVVGAASLRALLHDNAAGIDEGPDYVPGPGYGYGLGVAVRRAAGSALPGTPGQVYWLGRASTSFLVDRAEGVAAVMMAQRYGTARRYQARFQQSVYEALGRAPAETGPGGR